MGSVNIQILKPLNQQFEILMASSFKVNNLIFLIIIFNLILKAEHLELAFKIKQLIKNRKKKRMKIKKNKNKFNCSNYSLYKAIKILIR